MAQKENDGYIFNINKPVNWTSFDVVKKIRAITGIKKVGHAGTLDPFATGVLIICTGKATKKINGLMNLEKEYIAKLCLGETTDTLDNTGTVTEKKKVPKITGDNVLKTFTNFIGDIKQQIPNYSAAKVRGQRRYKLAREGEEIPTSFKSIHIYNLEIINFNHHSIEFKVICSRGTYVRMLGYDIAKKLGTVGYLSALTRTRIGKYSISDAFTISEFEKDWV